MAGPCWIEKIYAPDDTQRDSVSGEFFKNTQLESVVREAIQNSLDARDASAGMSVVRIFYSGTAAAVPGADYAKAFRGEKIDPHYAHKKSGLESVPSADEPCVYLTIEDFNTTGLTGDVTRRPTDEELEGDRIKGNYYNYFFRENRSDKNGAGALGSWGAGKIMFMKASRLRTAFSLSVRDDAVHPRFLAGRSVLMSHSVDGITYGPDYWFGVYMPCADAKNDHMCKQPITDAKWIDDFSKRFHLKRTDEKGTSIVIPYLDVQDESGADSFSQENIVCAVLKNFLLAILNGELRVEIETGDGKAPVTVDASSLASAKKYLPVKPDAKIGQVTRAHYELAAKAIDTALPPSQTVILKHANPNSKPVWIDEIFKDIDLKDLKKRLNDGKVLLFTVPMTVQSKSAKGKVYSDKFRVALVRSSDPDSFRTAYYRAGLLINDAANKFFTGYVSLVDIANTELAKLLAASEPPSHNEWDAGADRVKKAYYNPSAHINFVTSAVNEIVSRIEAADQEPDKNVLSGSFGIPIDEPSPTPPPVCPVCGKHPCVCGKQPEPTPPEQAIPEEFLHLSKLQSKVGFTLSMKEDRVSEKGYPVKCPFVMGYAPFTKSSWSKFDFRLDDAETIKIEFEKPEQSEFATVEAVDNRLTLTVKKPGAFRISVTGFDPNRDLEVSKKHYEYSEQKGED